MTDRQIEILAPAGSYDCFRAAVSAGADAVYAGGSRFGARAYADNFTEEELIRAIEEAHLFGKKLYLTLNTLLKDSEMEELYDYLSPFYEKGLDAVIVQDTGVMEYIRTRFPGLDIHASTQMTITGYPGAAFFEQAGAVRVVPARELSLSEIREIREHTDLEIECFVHGALCYCYSGQCLLSSVIGGRSGNRGQCAQPCRLPWTVNGHRKYYMSLKDMCTLDLIPDLTEAGVAFTVNPTIVRGLDYYTRTVFEFVSNDLGAQSTVCGGGRYDGLIEQMGGKPTPGLGFGLGMERLMLILQAQGIELPEDKPCEIFLVSMGDAASRRAFALCDQLHRCGVAAEVDVCGRSLKAQMKYANKLGAAFTMVLGDDELQQGKAQVKNMKTGEVSTISLGETFMQEYLAVTTQMPGLTD